MMVVAIQIFINMHVCVYLYRKIIWIPLSDSTRSLISLTFKAKAPSSKPFCILPRQNDPRSPPRLWLSPAFQISLFWLNSTYLLQSLSFFAISSNFLRMSDSLLCSGPSYWILRRFPESKAPTSEKSPSTAAFKICLRIIRIFSIAASLGIMIGSCRHDDGFRESLCFAKICKHYIQSNKFWGMMERIAALVDDKVKWDPQLC